MRYHWGFGVGHFHAHQFSSNGMSHQSRSVDIPDDTAPNQLPGSNDVRSNVEDDPCHELDDPEMTLEDREFEGWEDVESDDLKGDDASDDQSSGDDSDG